MKPKKNALSKFAIALSAPDARFYAYAAFFVFAFFTGGGARDDIQSLILLRPVAVLFCAYALTVKAPGQWQGRLFPLYLLYALAALMLLQLTPLPPSIWAELPGRKIFADIANIAGMEQPWRPLTLSPSETLNSLFSLAVPIAAMMLYLNLERGDRRKALIVIIILSIISALWAIFQLVGPAQGPLYLYRVTNNGSAVGLFANRNHQAVLLAAVIVLLGWFAATVNTKEPNAAAKFYGSLAAIFVFVPLIIITGSRAGLIMMVPALVVTLYLVYFRSSQSGRESKSRRATSQRQGLLTVRTLGLIIGIAAIIGVIVSSILLSRSEAIDRLFGSDSIEEVRQQVLPILFTMLKNYAPFGSGFGTFEHIYLIYEPQSMLDFSYLNQAHNDWLQFPIEGGVPALMLAAIAIIWLATRMLILIRNWQGAGIEKNRALACFVIIILFAAASLGDYPLRVPSIMSILAVIFCVLNDSIKSIQHREIK